MLRLDRHDLSQKASLSQGWTHIPGGGQSLPRVVYYHPVLKSLIHAPLPELSQLHLGNPLAVLGPNEITANAAQPLGEAPHMVASGGNSSDANVTFALPTVSGRFGVRVMGGADGTGGVVAYVDYVHGQRAHKVGFEPPCAECNSPVDELTLLPDEDEITIRVFSDRTVIEAFWEDGRVAMTTGGAADDGKFGPGQRGSMEIVSGVDVKLVGASVSAMGSIWLPSPSDLRPLKSDEHLLQSARDTALRKRRGLREARIRHHFVPELQAPAVPLGPGHNTVNVTRDLGNNNPSIQFDGTNWHYHFARGDAGWISAFELANKFAIHRIYCKRRGSSSSCFCQT